MRNPNGYGSVVKLSGNRRRPFVVRKTTGWNDKGHPIYQVIGYYTTQEEGLIALANYNKNPYDVESAKITLEELYQKWKELKAPKLGKSLQQALKSAYKHTKPIQGMCYREIKSFHMQDCIDHCGCGYSTQGAIKNLFGHLDKFAMEMDVIQKMYSELITSEPIPETDKKPFSDEEIKTLWEHQKDPWVDSVLILIYSGWRISELLDLKKQDVDTQNQTMTGGTKTKSGKGRIVPIHSKVQQFIEQRLNSSTAYLIEQNGKKISTETFYTHWNKIMNDLEMKHTPHECRHTFRSALDSVGANKKCIDLMMGHKSKDVGERVYTHKTIEELKEAIELVTR